MTYFMTGATRHSVSDIEDILRWYVESGVDLAVDEIAQDRFAPVIIEKTVSRQVEQSRLPESARNAESRNERSSVAPISPDEAAAAAQNLATSAMTLNELRQAMETFNGCALKLTATQLVFGDGNENAKLMIVGDSPGKEEDLTGLPFTGPAGELLNKMLEAIHLTRKDVYVTNIVPWRPPGNRVPTVQENAICKPFITRQIELINPDLLICLGAPAAQILLNQKAGIASMRGSWIDYTCGKRLIKVIPMLHPAYLLRQPLQKRLFWKDLLSVLASLKEL